MCFSLLQTGRLMVCLHLYITHQNWYFKISENLEYYLIFTERDTIYTVIGSYSTLVACL